MLDAQAIKNMDGVEKLRALDEFVSVAFPGITNTALGEVVLGYSRRQIQKWRAEPDKIPAVVLLYLQELARPGDDGAAAKRAMLEAAGRMGDAAIALRDAVTALTR